MNRSAIDLWVGIFVALGLGAIAFLGTELMSLRMPIERIEAQERLGTWRAAGARDAVMTI